MVDETLTIDVWSEIACPWCYIGKRRLEDSVTAFSKEHPAVDVAVEFHSFILAPDTVQTVETAEEFEGSEVDFLVQHKGIPAAHARAMLARVVAEAADVGLVYDFDAIRHASTLKAHQLIRYAKAHGAQSAAKERIQRAYFTEGLHLGRDETLADLAVDVGLDRDDVLRSLAAEEYLAAVWDDHHRGVSLGVTGVPFFVIDGRYALSGAQPAAALREALDNAAASRERA